MKTVHASRKRSALLDAYSDAGLAAQGIFLTKQAMVERLLAPHRGHALGDPKLAGLAPVWAATLVDRMTRVFFDDMSHRDLVALTTRLLSREALALAAHVVLNTVLPEVAEAYVTTWPPGMRAEERVDWGVRRRRAWDALERLAWSNT